MSSPKTKRENKQFSRNHWGLQGDDRLQRLILEQLEKGTQLTTGLLHSCAVFFPLLPTQCMSMGLCAPRGSWSSLQRAGGGECIVGMGMETLWDLCALHVWCTWGECREQKESEHGTKQQWGEESSLRVSSFLWLLVLSFFRRGSLTPVIFSLSFSSLLL